MKRIGINKKLGKGRVRVSRTSTPNISETPAEGVTINSAHGLRLSRSWGGLQAALQNSTFILKGRWASKSDTNLNLSKSGLSVSQRTSFGTLNITNPNRSSANIFGVNLRGKKAAKIVGVLALIEFAVRATLAIFSLTLIIVRLAIYLIYLAALLLKLVTDLLIFCLSYVVSWAKRFSMRR